MRRGPEAATVRRVFLVVPELEFRTGGAQQAVALAQLLARRDIDTTVFPVLPASPDPGYERELRTAGVGLVCGRAQAGGLPRLTSRSADAMADRLWQRRRRPHPKADLVDRIVETRPEQADIRRRLRRAAAVARPDVVHAHGFRLDTAPAAAIAACDGHPAVYTEHAALAEGDEHFPMTSDWAWAVLPAADVICCVSSGTEDMVRAVVPESALVRGSSHIVEPPAVDTRRTPEDVLSVLCLSRLSAEKGPDVLVEALGLLRQRGIPARTTLAGYGLLQPQLEQRVAELGLSDATVFRGGYEHGDVTNLLGSADVVVSTSHSEAKPVALIEAFAHGVPVVATAVGGVPDIVVDGVNGLLVPASDAVATADALARMHDPALRARLAAGARRSFEQGGYTPDRVFAATIDIYELARSRAMERGVSLPTGPITELRRAAARAVTQMSRARMERRAGAP